MYYVNRNKMAFARLLHFSFTGIPMLEKKGMGQCVKNFFGFEILFKGVYLGLCKILGYFGELSNR